MNSSNRSPSNFWAGILLVLDAVFWFVLPYQLIMTVPKFKRVFDDFGLKVPMLTEAVVSVSMWFVDYWWVIFLPFLIFLAIIVVIGFLCRNRSSKWFWLWWLFTIGPAIVLNLIVLYAVEGPYMELMEGLRK